ncbi:MAG: hypothetical protein ACREBD_12425 [Blastocatellia bacterium]
MPTDETELWARAQQARDKLAQQFLSHPQVSLIDIGFETESGEPSGHIVLRIHLRQPGAGQTLGIPEKIDGIPIRVVTGDYHPE